MSMFGQEAVTFKKQGKEIKSAISRRMSALAARLKARNKVLEKFVSNSRKVRSYLVRSSNRNYDMHTGEARVLISKHEVSSEEIEDITQLCKRILQIEEELHYLDLVRTHLDDDEVCSLTLADLIRYGFDSAPH